MAVCNATIFSSALATDGKLTIPAPTRATVQGLSFILVRFRLVWFILPGTFVHYATGTRQRSHNLCHGLVFAVSCSFQISCAIHSRLCQSLFSAFFCSLCQNLATTERGRPRPHNARAVSVQAITPVRWHVAADEDVGTPFIAPFAISIMH